MLLIKKDKGEIVFAYANESPVPVQGRITYNVLDKTRVTFSMMAQTVKANHEVRDIGMLLAAIGTDLMLETEQGDKDDGTP